MKKILTAAALFLALSLCLTVAVAGGGSAGDPLVSLSYLESIFSPSAESQVQQKLNQAATSTREEADRLLTGMKADVLAASGLNTALSPQEATMNSGDVLSGTTGLTVLPLAGEIRLTLAKGDVVDATTGTEVPTDTILTLNHRYIVAESALARFTAVSPTAIVSYEGSYALSLSETTPNYFAIARALRDLDLFRGTGSGIGEGFDLHLTPTRTEGLVMFIRILGEEQAALSCQYTHPYTDVPAWADRYVAWAHHQGYTNGISATLFGSSQAITATQYEEFLLRALGYSTVGVEDYTTALSRARDLGILTEGEFQMLSQDTFLRAYVAYISYYALDVPLRGTEQTLAQRLQAAGLFSEYQLATARILVDSSRLS